MKNIFLLSLINFALIIQAQNVNPNEIRLKVYDTITHDINKQHPEYLHKKIVIDPTINKFNDLQMDEFGVKLDSVIYDANRSFCTKFSPYQCVQKFEIDRFKLTNVYKDKNETLNHEFYGIYAPLDHWYNLIYFAAVNHFEKDRTFQFQTVIPVRRVYLQQAEMKEEYYFYRFLFDEKFKILQVEKLP